MNMNLYEHEHDLELGTMSGISIISEAGPPFITYNIITCIRREYQGSNLV
jgi:hypothetical protein